jgi:hypothetical protein
VLSNLEAKNLVVKSSIVTQANAGLVEIRCVGLS